MNADKILRMKDAAELFNVPYDEVKLTYRRLRSEWHPDRNKDPKAKEVTQKIEELIIQFEGYPKEDWFPASGSLELVDHTGRKFNLGYLAKRQYPLGIIIFGPGIVSYLANKSYADLVESGEDVLEHRLKFHSLDMKTEIGKSVPVAKDIFSGLKDNWVVNSRRKPSGSILGRDLLAHFGGALDPKHAAWCISRLMNVACWLEYSKICHNAITLDNIFIHPEKHSVFLAGGWEYSTVVDRKIKALPADVVDYIGSGVLASKTATLGSDRELIRALGRTLLGCVSPGNLRMKKDIPRPIIEWLTHPAGPSAVADYKLWDDVLVKSFGPRRFTVLDVNFNDVYPH